MIGALVQQQKYNLLRWQHAITNLKFYKSNPFRSVVKSGMNQRLTPTESTCDYR